MRRPCRHAWLYAAACRVLPRTPATPRQLSPNTIELFAIIDDGLKRITTDDDDDDAGDTAEELSPTTTTPTLAAHRLHAI